MKNICLIIFYKLLHIGDDSVDIRQLRYFIAIVEEGKISAAAKRLHMSQPPLSQQLKAMEDELGSKLVERTRNGLNMTSAGRTLYTNAVRITQLMEETKSEVIKVGQGVNGRLTIGMNTLSANGFLEVLARFRERYPEVTYTIQQNESTYLCQLVRDQQVEVAVIYMPLDLDDFTVLHLYNEPFYFITSTQAPHMSQDPHLDEIEGSPLLLPSTRGLGVHYQVQEAFARFKLEPNIIGECSDISLLMDLVATNFATSLVPETVLHRYRDYPVHAYRLSDEVQLMASVGLIWRKDRTLSKVAQNFVELIQEQI